MSWLSDAWKRNRSAIGNFAKNVSPFVAFTPLGALGSAGLAIAGEASRGKTKLSDLARAGASNAGIGKGLKFGAGRLASAFTPGSSNAASTVYTQGPSGQWMSAGSPVTAAAPAPPGVGSNPLKALSRPIRATYGAAKKDPLAALDMAGRVAGGVLGAREQSAQSDLMREQFDFQKQQYTDQEARRRRLQELLAPLLQPRGH